ncbi:hypothetical protein MCETARE7_00176 [Candidatus Nanopelagicaceae bacterium]
MRELKCGVALSQSATPGQYFLGTLKRVIRIYSPEEKVIALALVGGKSENEILQTPNVLSATVSKLLAQLEVEELVNHKQGVLRVSQRFVSKLDNRVKKNSRPAFDAGVQQLQRRCAPELNQTNWISGVIDGGVEMLSARQNYLCEISGNNRVATLLYSLLLASGLSQVRFTPTSRGRYPLIGDIDMALSTFRQSDTGTAFKSHCEMMRRELALFPLDREENYLDEASTPDLRIHCGDINPETLSLWMSSGEKFLIIPTPRADSALIGPLVIPGASPCLRCYELSSREQRGVVDHLEFTPDVAKEYPQIAAHFIAAMAASMIVQFCDAITVANQRDTAADFSALLGIAISIDYQLLAYPQVVAIPRHPHCGCAF